MPIPPGLTVGALMTRDPLTVSSNDRLSAAHEIMERRGIQHLPVTDGDGKLVGMLSERNLHDALPSILTLKDPESRRRSLELTRVEQVASTTPVSVPPNTPVIDAVSTMRRLRVGSVAVVDGDRLVGIVTTGDLLNLLSEALGAE